MKDKVLKLMQRFSKAIVVPVMFLPAIGIATVVCNVMINPNIAEYIPFLKNETLYTTFKVLYDALMSIFTNLGPIFAIGIALGLAKKKKEQAALVSFMCLFVYLAAQQGYLSITGQLADPAALYGSGQAMMLGFQVIDMGVFIGIIMGVIIGLLHNRYCDKDLGTILSVYGGTRFVFLLGIPIVIVLAIANTYLWPPIQDLITKSSEFMLSSGPFGYFSFGFLDRLLIPTGLHHLIGSPIWYTELGGVATVAGEVYTGAWNIALAELADPNVAKLSETVIFNNTNLVKIFGLSGASLAMIKCAKPELKTKAKAIIIPAILTSVLAGITEPIEFTFLFLSPMLWLIYSLLAGSFFALLSIFNIATISAGGLIETLLYNVPAGAVKTEWPLYMLMGLVQAVVFYFVFVWFIKKKNLKTPGREDDGEVKLITKEDYDKRQGKLEVKDNENKQGKEASNVGEIILKAVGGEANIAYVDNCFTRLRLELKDTSLVDEALLKQHDAKGVVNNGSEVQIIYGVNVNKYRKALEDSMEVIPS